MLGFYRVKGLYCSLVTVLGPCFASFLLYQELVFWLVTVLRACLFGCYGAEGLSCWLVLLRGKTFNSRVRVKNGKCIITSF